MFSFLLFVSIEEVCRPAVHKAWITSEPKHHQEDEEGKDTQLPEGHGAKTAVLLFNHIIGRNLLLCLHRPTAPCLFEAIKLQDGLSILYTTSQKGLRSLHSKK